MQNQRPNIIVTSAGTASAISVIRALRSQQEIQLKVIAVDNDPLAAGLFLADSFALVPRADHPDYINTLIKLAQQYNAGYLIPIYSKEIGIVAAEAEKLKLAGLNTFLSSADTILTCNDKKKMNLVAEKAGVLAPKVFDEIELDQMSAVSLPVFAKPNSGSSSSGAELINSIERLIERRKEKNLIVQSVVLGEEVTVDVLCNEHSEPIVVAPRSRLATKSGQSVKAETLDPAPFLNPVSKICKQLGLIGVCNLQFFRNDNALVFIELNPRFAAGGLMLTISAGANIPLLLLQLMRGEVPSKQTCITKTGYKMTRYWQEIILDENGEVI